MSELPAAVDMPAMVSEPTPEGANQLKCWVPDPTKYYKHGTAVVVPRAKSSRFSGANRGFTPGAYDTAVLEQPDDQLNPRPITRVDPTEVTPELSRRIYDEVVAEMGDIADADSIAIEVYRRLGMRSGSTKSGKLRKLQLPNMSPAGDSVMEKPKMPPTPRRKVTAVRPEFPELEPSSIDDNNGGDDDDMLPTTTQRIRKAATVLKKKSANSKLLRSLAETQATIAQQLATMGQEIQKLKNTKPVNKQKPTREEVRKRPDPARGKTAAAEIQQNFAKYPVSTPPSDANPMVSLKIPDLGVEAQPPEWEVEFDFGEMGSMQARYHWVVEESGGLFLVYDRRFKLGNSYTPPNLKDRQITIRLSRANASYSCLSPKYTLTFGVFHIVCLIIVDREPGRTPKLPPGAHPALTDVMPLGTMLGAEDPFAISERVSKQFSDE